MSDRDFLIFFFNESSKIKALELCFYIYCRFEKLPYLYNEQFEDEKFFVKKIFSLKI